MLNENNSSKTESSKAILYTNIASYPFCSRTFFFALFQAFILRECALRNIIIKQEIYALSTVTKFSSSCTFCKSLYKIRILSKRTNLATGFINRYFWTWLVDLEPHKFLCRRLFLMTPYNIISTSRPCCVIESTDMTTV